MENGHLFSSIGDMANIVTSSFAAFRESLLVLSGDKKMLLLPALCGVAAILAIAAFASAVFLTAGPLGLFSLLFIVALYPVLYFIAIFFFSAMVIYSSLRLEKSDPTVSESIKRACRKIPNILSWTLFSSTIGVILELVNRITGEKLEMLISLAWSLATFFVIPVMIFEDKRPLEALKGSVDLFKKRWGEAVSGIVGIGLSVLILGAIGLLLFAGALKIAPDTALFGSLAFAAYVLFLVILYNTLNSIYIAGLYHFAVTGKVAGGFSEETIRGAGLCGRR